MFYYKINNLVNINGQCDYKGLEINKIITGSQVYPYDLLKDNRCIIASTENITPNGDLIQITEQEYVTLKAEIESTYPTTQPNKEEILEGRVLELENTILMMQGVI